MNRFQSLAIPWLASLLVSSPAASGTGSILYVDNSEGTTLTLVDTETAHRRAAGPGVSAPTISGHDFDFSRASFSLRKARMSSAMSRSFVHCSL